MSSTMASELILVSEFLQLLVECSEKAAKIAQIFREEKDLFQLLVEEKSAIEKNKCFFRDFKTLADVLVQETIKKDIGQINPVLISNIKGEEQNKFQNALGESIVVEITEEKEDTIALLKKVLDGRDHVAKALAAVVHSREVTCQKEFISTSLVPANKIGIWIDPIDCTAEYIQAKEEEEEESRGIQQYGLKCVCVLIGAFHLDTGKPFAGVVNQPFFEFNSDESKWESSCNWGVDYEPFYSSSIDVIPSYPDRVVVLSTSEDENLRNTISSNYEIVHAAGAGYKLVQVITGMADLYVLSQATTFYWDICGPHALLLALGGGIVSFREAVSAPHLWTKEDLLENQVSYLDKSGNNDFEEFRNKGGLIAYRNPNDVIELLDLICNGKCLASN